MKLDGLVALVTGGASGLGEATVKALIAAGCKVVISDLQEKLGEQLVEAVGGTEKAIFVKTDVSNEDQVKVVINKTVEKFGALHILINCAGVFSAGPILSSKDLANTKEMRKVLDINVLGTFNMCKYAAKQMVKQSPVTDTTTNMGDKLIERGVIINVASIAAFQATRGNVVYSASKGAIAAMTLPMARDLGIYGIRVVAVAPGIFPTPMMDMTAAGVEIMGKIIRKGAASNRLGDPVDFASLCISIAQNSFLNGTVIHLDGGLILPHI